MSQKYLKCTMYHTELMIFPSTLRFLPGSPISLNGFITLSVKQSATLNTIPDTSYNFIFISNELLYHLNFISYNSFIAFLSNGTAVNPVKKLTGFFKKAT